MDVKDVGTHSFLSILILVVVAQTAKLFLDCLFLHIYPLTNLLLKPVVTILLLVLERVCMSLPLRVYVSVNCY